MSTSQICTLVTEGQKMKLQVGLLFLLPCGFDESL